MNKIEHVLTDRGNDLLKQLTHDGWKITSEYGKLMFDKRGDQELEFTWANWDEWSVDQNSKPIKALLVV